jgi:hypothetical protein
MDVSTDPCSSAIRRLTIAQHPGDATTRHLPRGFGRGTLVWRPAETGSAPGSRVLGLVSAQDRLLALM